MHEPNVHGENDGEFSYCILLGSRYIIQDHIAGDTDSMRSSRSRRSPSPEKPIDFKTEYHPRSHRPPLFQQQESFGLRDLSDTPSDSQPWRPFVEEGDYIFSEIALQAGLNNSSVNSLLTLISRISQGKAKVTLRNEVDLRRAWDRAAAQLTPVRSSRLLRLLFVHNLSKLFPVRSTRRSHSVQRRRQDIRSLCPPIVGLGSGSIIQPPARTSFCMGCPTTFQTQRK